MKILIVSDTHKSHGNLEKAIQDAGRIDMLIHLGDVEGAEDYIRALVDCPAHTLNPLYSGGLWLAVIMTPPCRLRCLTAK